MPGIGNNGNYITYPNGNVEPITSHEQVGKKEAERFSSPCSIHIHSIRKRLADADGISGKAAIDGLVHAGILPDDSARFVKKVTYSQEKVQKGGKEETIISITFYKEVEPNG